MNTFERYYKAVHFIDGLSNLQLEGDYMIRQRNLGIYLARMRYFLELLGNPDKGIKFVHVTGTSGKGTVTNTIHEMFNAAGKKVGSFTSPFVTTPIEKIKVGDLYIDPDEFADIVEYLKPFIDEMYLKGPYGRPSYFEIFLAIGFLYFKRKNCEWVVLEVGLGGRYDATNVIEKPVVTAITGIDYDHTHILGKTLKKIAYDKAGIIKKGSTFFTAEQRSPLLKMFQEICDENGAKLHRVPRQPGYREYNKALSVMIGESLGIDEASIQKGIETARLQCRFEIMQQKPLVILDGAHNRSKIKSTVDNLKALSFDKLHLVIGIAENKDSASILEQIIPYADSVCITRFQAQGRRCAQPKELLYKASKYLKKSAKIIVFLDSERALSEVLKNAGEKDAVLVVGSFFLAGELRKKWFPEEWILKRRKNC